MKVSEWEECMNECADAISMSYIVMVCQFFCRTNRRTFSTSKPLLCTGLLVLHAVYPGQLKITWRQLKSKFYFPFIQVTLHSERGRFIAKKAENKQKRHTPGKRKGHFLVPVKRPRPKLGCWLIHRVIFNPRTRYHKIVFINAENRVIKRTFNSS